MVERCLIIVIAMLLISLVESLLVLPNHLSHMPGPEWVPTNALLIGSSHGSRIV